MNYPENAHIHNLTGLRGFAAMAVVLCHMAGRIFYEFPFINHLFGKGYLGVDVFFVLSGFIISYVYNPVFSGDFNFRDYKLFILKRFARIYPAHIFSLILISVTLLIFSLLKPDFFDKWHNTTGSFIKNVLLIHAWETTNATWQQWNYPSWSVSAEWFAYLFIAVPVMKLLKSITLIPLLGLTLFSWLLLNPMYQPFAQTHLIFGPLFCLLRISNAFLIGYTIYRLYCECKLGSITINLILLTGIIALVLIVLAEQRIANIFIGPTAALIILGLSKSSKTGDLIFNNKLIFTLGKISYSIYLLHIPVLTVFAPLNKRFFPMDKLEFVSIYAIFLIGCILACAAFTYKFVEEPLRKKIVAYSQVKK